MRRGIFIKMTLTHIPDPNRTAINFVHVNGRLLYMNWRIVVMVEKGNVLHHVKREGELFGWGMLRGTSPGKYVQGEMSGFRLH